MRGFGLSPNPLIIVLLHEDYHFFSLVEILWLIALLIAVKEALDKEWFVTIVSAFLSWLGWIVIRFVFLAILFWLGFAANWFGAFFDMIFG